MATKLHTMHVQTDKGTIALQFTSSRKMWDAHTMLCDEGYRPVVQGRATKIFDLTSHKDILSDVLSICGGA